MLPAHAAALSDDVLADIAVRLARDIATAREVLSFMPADLAIVGAELHRRGIPLPSGVDVLVAADGTVTVQASPRRG